MKKFQRRFRKSTPIPPPPPCHFLGDLLNVTFCYLNVGMEIAVHWFGLDIDVQFWSQHISFILVGLIVVTSTRGLLLTMSKFFIWISSPKSSNFIVLFLSQIMGMYFVAMVLLMRMNMPVQYRSIVTEVLGDLQFNFYHRWFDVMFLVAALCTIAILTLAHKRDYEPADAQQNFARAN